MTLSDLKDLVFNKRTESAKPSYQIAYGATIKEGNGEVKRNLISRPEGLGEDHPFDFQQMEDTYKKFSYAHGVVDKYVDFIIGGGFFVKTEDNGAGSERALEPY